MAEPVVRKTETEVKQAGRPRSMFWVLAGGIALAVILGIVVLGGYWDALWN